MLGLCEPHSLALNGITTYKRSQSKPKTPVKPFCGYDEIKRISIALYNENLKAIYALKT